MNLKVWYWWRSRRRLWAIALAWRLLFGRGHKAFTRTWSFGPLTVALTDLDGDLYKMRKR